MTLTGKQRRMMIASLLFISIFAFLVIVSPVFAKTENAAISDVLGWLIAQFFNLLMRIVLGFVDNFRNVFTSMFFPDMDLGNKSSFLQVFGGSAALKPFKDAFAAIGLSAATILFIVAVIKGMMGDTYRSENPWNLTMRYMICLFLIFNLQGFTSVVFTFGRGMYQTIQNVETPSQKEIAKEEASKTMYTDNGITNTDAFSKKFSKNIDKTGAADTHWAVSFGSAILTAICIVAIGLAFLRLMLEIIERYILCGVLWLFMPVGIAGIATEETTQNFRNYMMTLITTMLLMGMNIFFYKIADVSMTTLVASSAQMGQSDYITRYFITCAMILALLRIARRFDGYLNAMGFSSLRTGEGMLGEMVAATSTAISGARKAAKGVKIAKKGAEAATNGYDRFVSKPMSEKAKNEKVREHYKERVERKQMTGSGDIAQSALKVKKDAKKFNQRYKASKKKMYASQKSKQENDKRMAAMYNHLSPAAKNEFEKRYAKSADSLDASTDAISKWHDSDEYKHFQKYEEKKGK